MDIEDYRNFLDRLGYEGYSLINQTSDLLKEKKREEITPYQAVKNALKNTTTDKVYEASTMEKEEKDINKELGNDK